MHTWLHRGLSAALLAVSTAATLAAIAPAQAATTFTTVQNSTIRQTNTSTRTNVSTTPKASTTVTTTTSPTGRIGGTVVRPPVQPQSRDRLGNFEIQDLMSRYNQAEAL